MDKKNFVALAYGRIEKRLCVTQCYINPFFQQHRGKYWVIEWFIEVGVCQIHWSFVHIILPAGFDGKGALNEDNTVWLYGARPPPMGLIMI
jgi:hypothetical protein